jgi:signal transduction histidine kinase
VIDRIAGRLFLSYLAVVALALIVASVLVSGLLIQYENGSARQRLIGIQQPLYAAVTNGLRQGRTPQDIVAGLADQVRASTERILIVATQGRRVIADSEERLVGQVLMASPSGIGEVFSFRDQGEEWLYVQRAINPASQLLVARPRAVFVGTLPALVPAMGLSLLAAGLLALLVAAVIARTITRPLSDLVAGVRRFASGDLRSRVGVGGPHEVRDLGVAFNTMADEIERARGSERAFLADISHELRTPLTSIHGFSQAIVEGEVQAEGVAWAAKTIQRETRRLIRMVEGLLQVARIEAGAGRADREPVTVDDVIRSAISAIEAQARDADVRIAPDIARVPPVMGDPDRLSQLFLNVLDNAVKHSPKGASVDIGTETLDGTVLVKVRDHGGGIPAGTEKKVFERFYRGANADHSGAGLGLAIAQAIAQDHGGRIEARNVDGGAEFTIVLPSAGGEAVPAAT